MGVSEYRLSHALPAPLAAALPTREELAREFPLLSLVKLRIDIEREIRALLADAGMPAPPVESRIEEMNTLHVMPSAAEMLSFVDSLNKAAHGIEVSDRDAVYASNVAERFLRGLQTYRASLI